MADSRNFDAHQGHIAGLSHSAAMLMLRRVQSSAPRDLLNSLIETPLTISASSHDTGTQVDFTLEADGMTPLIVWVGSWWDSYGYHSNDRKKVLGVQPGCDFARPLVAAFFTRLQEHIEAEETAKVEAKAGTEITQVVALNATRRAWAARIADHS